MTSSLDSTLTRPTARRPIRRRRFIRYPGEPIDRRPKSRELTELAENHRWNVSAAAKRMRALTDDELAEAVTAPRRSPHVTSVYAHEAARLVMCERLAADQPADMAALAVAS